MWEMKTINHFKGKKYNLHFDVRLEKIQRRWDTQIGTIKQLIVVCDLNTKGHKSFSK
jgi:hypothetical protein